MKALKVLTAVTAVALTGFALAAFADDATNTPPAHHRGPAGNGPMPERLLMPRILEGLNLTADQKTSLESLESAFKKDVEKWRAENPIDFEALRKARESDDKDALKQFKEKREGLMAIRKGYLDKLRASLTDEQKAKLDKEIEAMRARMDEHRQQGGPKTAPAE